MSALAALRDHRADLVKACPAMSAFLINLVSDTEIGRMASRRLDDLTADDLGTFAPLLRIPVLVRAAIDATECALRGLEKAGEGPFIMPVRMIASARRMATGGRVIGVSARQDYREAIRLSGRNNQILMAAAFTACAANALASVKQGIVYVAIDDDAPFKAGERGFPGAAAAAYAIGFASMAAPTQGCRGAISHIAARAITDALSPTVRA